MAVRNITTLGKSDLSLIAKKMFVTNFAKLKQTHPEYFNSDKFVFKSVTKISHYNGEYLKMISTLKDMLVEYINKNEEYINEHKKVSHASAQNLVDYFNNSTWWPKIEGTSDQMLKELSKLPPKKPTHYRIIVLEKMSKTITNENVQKQKYLNNIRSFRQYRGNEFKVVNIFDKLNPTRKLNNTLNCSSYIGTSSYNGTFTYPINCIVTSAFNKNLFDDSGDGIYYFDSLENAFNESQQHVIGEICDKLEEGLTTGLMNVDDIINQKISL